MPDTSPFRFRDAVELLVQPDSKVLQAFDMAATAVILTGAATGTPGILALMDPKNEMVKLGGHVLQHVKKRASGERGYTRSRLLTAAHTVVLVTSYFEVVANELEGHSLSLSAKEQALLVADKDAASSRDLIEILAHAEVPHPNSTLSPEGATEELRQFYSRLASSVERFIEGLHSFDNLASYEKQSIVSTICDVSTIESAIEQYHDMLRLLSVEVREFELWVRAFDAGHVRGALDDVSLSLRESTRNLHSAVIALSGPSNSADVYQSILAEERKILTTPPDVERINPAAPLVVPALSDLYIEPAFRTSRSASPVQAADERWWRGVPVRSDLSKFVLSLLLADPESYISPTLILGHPGAGKSSFMRILEAHLAGTAFVPIRVELRGVDPALGISEQLEECIREKISNRVRWSDFRGSTSSVPVIMLDGLDELLQASAESMADYLERLRDFQVQQKAFGGVVILVTSRTLVANRTRIPSGSLVVKLEDFDEERVAKFVNKWNVHNAGRVAMGQSSPVPYPLPSEMRELASQPLLLLLVSLLLDEDSTDVGDAATRTRSGTYRHIIRTFVRRELQKTAPELTEDELEKLIDREVLNLGYAAIGMHNRGLQHITGADLQKDLAALRARSSGEHGRRAATDFFGRFLFVHANTARQPGGQVASAFEFLHATLGEFLVAELACDALDEIITHASRASLFAFADKPDRTAATLLAFESLTARQSVLEFMLERLSKIHVPDADSVVSLLEDLIRLTIDHPTENWRGGEYAPVDSGIAARVAYYTSNLAVIAAGWVEAHGITRLRYCDAKEWQSWATLWRSQLRPASWDSLITSMTVVLVPGPTAQLLPSTVDYRVSAGSAPEVNVPPLSATSEFAYVHVVDRRLDRLEHRFLGLPGELRASETLDPADGELRIVLAMHPLRTLGGADVLAAVSQCSVETAPSVSDALRAVFRSIAGTRAWVLANVTEVYSSQCAHHLDPELAGMMVTALGGLVVELSTEQRVAVGEFLVACSHDGSVVRELQMLIDGVDLDALIEQRPDLAFRLWNLVSLSGFRFLGSSVNDWVRPLDECDFGKAAERDPSAVVTAVVTARRRHMVQWAVRRGAVAVADSSSSVLRLLPLEEAAFLVRSAAYDAMSGPEKLRHFRDRYAEANRSNGRAYELARVFESGKRSPALLEFAMSLHDLAGRLSRE